MRLVGVRFHNYTGVHSPFSAQQKHVNFLHKHVGMSRELNLQHIVFVCAYNYGTCSTKWKEISC